MAETPLRLFLSLPVPSRNLHVVELNDRIADEVLMLDSAKAGARNKGILAVLAVGKVLDGGISSDGR